MGKFYAVKKGRKPGIYESWDECKKQTLGFEKIEWVVVIHNSEKHYFDDVQDIVKGFENVKVFELHNDVRPPSSPRNYALDRCTGKYIAFM